MAVENEKRLTPEDIALLRRIAEEKRYPIARFELWSSRERELRSTALDNVRLEAAEEPMDTVKARGAALARLAEAGCLVLDFRPAVTVASDYAVYGQSAIYAQLCELVEEGKSRPGFLFDRPHIRRGRAVLTMKGRRLLQAAGSQAE